MKKVIIAVIMLVSLFFSQSVVLAEDLDYKINLQAAEFCADSSIYMRIEDVTKSKKIAIIGGMEMLGDVFMDDYNSGCSKCGVKSRTKKGILIDMLKELLMNESSSRMDEMKLTLDLLDSRY